MFIKQLRVIGIVLLLTLAAVSLPAEASLVIEGPDLDKNFGWSDSGLQITTKQDITLESVVFINRGLADTVSVRYFNAIWEEQTLCSVNTPAGNTAFTVNLNCALYANKIYFIIYQQGDNTKYDNYANSTVSNDHIIVDGAVDSSRWRVTQPYWAGFKDITTTPEPATMILLAAGLPMLLRRRRSR
jgi:hypothetical protein